jgi:hypothetical protein
VDAVDDAVELVAAVGVGGTQVVERAELGEVAEAVLGRLGHRQLTRHEAAVTLAWRIQNASDVSSEKRAGAWSGGVGHRKKRVVKRIGVEVEVMKCER